MLIGERRRLHRGHGRDHREGEGDFGAAVLKKEGKRRDTRSIQLYKRLMTIHMCTTLALTLVLLGSRAPRKWVVLEKKCFEAPLEGRKERCREHTVISRDEIDVYVYKSFPEVASQENVCQIMATFGYQKSPYGGT